MVKPPRTTTVPTPSNLLVAAGLQRVFLAKYTYQSIDLLPTEAVKYELLAQDSGTKGECCMKKHIRVDEDKPIGKFRAIADFLPPPDKLALSEDMVKVTLLVDKESVSFFKQQAKHLRTKYQRMMREVLKWYVRHYRHA